MLAELASPDGRRLGIGVVATVIASVLVFELVRVVIPGDTGLLFAIVLAVYSFAVVPWLFIRIIADAQRGGSAVEPQVTEAGP